MMQTNFVATAAMIFSRVSAPPPPLIRHLLRVALVGAVDVDRNRVDLVEIEHLMPCATSWRVDCSELDTVPSIWSLRSASASMKCLTVEPVPTPTMRAPSR